MKLDRLLAVAESWRTELELYERRGQLQLAQLLASLIDDLEAGIEEWRFELLTLEAAQESGYSYSTLQQKLAKGPWLNAGERRSPRIRRCDLPLKGGRTPPSVEDGQPSLADEVLLLRAG